ncbi:hypothetical protein [Bifidobacterium cuniculi]|uniref:hypothetical protein n=1 Tax=Bifidobacterium cuniculi TaxID=1688 RepID=UPI0012DFF8FC|nr:hypothetical protein [Bifidobacterium cuniculi]
MSTRWLADRWGVSEYSVQRWERSRLLPDDLQADLLGLQVRFAAEVAKGIEEHGDAIIVPRTNAESVQDFPATWWRLIAWQIRLKTEVSSSTTMTTPTASTTRSTTWRATMSKRKNTVKLTPLWLPYIRDKLGTTFSELQRFRTQQVGGQDAYKTMMGDVWNVGDSIRTAPLWWVSRDMTTLASDTVDQGDFPHADAPSPTGMVFFDDGLPGIHADTTTGEQPTPIFLHAEPGRGSE